MDGSITHEIVRLSHIPSMMQFWRELTVATERLAYEREVELVVNPHNPMLPRPEVVFLWFKTTGVQHAQYHHIGMKLSRHRNFGSIREYLLHHLHLNNEQHSVELRYYNQVLQDEENPDSIGVIIYGSINYYIINQI